MNPLAKSAFASFLQRLTRAACLRPRCCIWPQLGLALLCLIVAAFGLKFNMNRDDLLNPRLKSQGIYRAMQKEFAGVGQDLVVVVQSESPERNRQFIERLAARIQPLTNLYSNVVYKTDLPSLGAKGLQLASVADLTAMRDALANYQPWLTEISQATNLDSLFNSVNRAFSSASRNNAAQNSGWLAAAPFLRGILAGALEDLAHPPPAIPPELEGYFGGSGFSTPDVYVTFNQGQTWLLTARPRNDRVVPAAIAQLRIATAAVKRRIPGVNVGLTGGPVLDDDELLQAQHDTTTASLAAFLLCTGLFILAYREIGRPVKAIVCVLIGLAYALGFATLVVGHLTILSITFVPILIGLAIDFSIHFISRYEEELRHGHPAIIAIANSARFTSPGIITAGLIVAAACLAMTLTGFTGIQEMGIITGGGLLLCLVPLLTALPVLLMPGSQPDVELPVTRPSRHRLKFAAFWLRHPWPVLAAAALLCAAAATQFHHLYFDYDLLHLQSRSLPSVIYEQKLIRDAGGSSLFGVVVADSLSQVRDFQDKISRLPAVARVRSAADYFSADAAEKLELVRAIKRELTGVRFAPVDPRPVDRQQLNATLWYLVGYLGTAVNRVQSRDPALAQELAALRQFVITFRVQALSNGPDSPDELTAYQQALFLNLRQLIESVQNQDADTLLRPADLPPTLHNRFIGRTGKFLLEVYPKNNLWLHATQKEFLRQLDSVVPPDRVTGMPVELYQYTTLLKNSYEQAGAYALVAVALIVLIRFRSFLWLALSLLPVAVGGIWLLGLMGLARLPFNPANIMTLPLVFGIGVTSGVQILSRFAEENNPSIVAKSTGKAVIVSGLTVTAGFGSLMLAAHQGIRSLGIVMSLGLLACTTAALIVLPGLLHLVATRRNRLRGRL